MTTVEMDGKTYRIGRLNAMDQWAVARRILPVLGALAGTKPDAMAGGRLDDFLPLMEAVARIPDDDVNAVLAKCLSKVEAQVAPNVWMPVWNVQAGQPQDTAMELPTLFKLVMEVVTANVGGFFPAPTGDAPGAAPG